MAKEQTAQSATGGSGLNIGDYRLFKSRKELVDRKSYADPKQARNVIFPGEVVLADAPNRNFTYYWFCPFGGDRGSMEAELEGLLESGWELVKPVEIQGKWKVASRFRRSPEGYVTWAGHILYALPAEVVEEREAAERARANPKGEVFASLGQFARDARSGPVSGIQPFIRVGKEEKDL